MDLKDAFLFKSRQRRQREEAEYQERIFHLGPGHREAALQRLKSLIREEKTEAELIYLYTCVKDIYTASRPGEREEALGGSGMKPHTCSRRIKNASSPWCFWSPRPPARMIFRGRKRWRRRRRAGGSGSALLPQSHLAARHTGPQYPKNYSDKAKIPQGGG